MDISLEGPKKHFLSHVLSMNEGISHAKLKINKVISRKGFLLNLSCFCHQFGLTKLEKGEVTIGSKSGHSW